MSWAPGDSIALETPRFVLRTLRAEDVDARFVAWMQAPEVLRLTHLRDERFDDASLRAWIAGHDGCDALLVGIFLRESGLAIGHLRAVIEPRQRRAELGAMVGDQAWWGRGVVLEARAAWMGFLFEEAGVERLYGEPFAANHAMLFNYQRQGFEQEGLLRGHAQLDGARADIVVFGMLRDAWRERQAGEPEVAT